MDFMSYHKGAFNRIGWFIPPYVTLGFLSNLAKHVHTAGATFGQPDLEDFLRQIYAPAHLAAMVTERYPVTPYIQDYREIISEAVTAHFMGLHHVAVAGLLPVIEGAAKKLAESRGVTFAGGKSVFIKLVADCKSEVTEKGIGAVAEVVVMLDSFLEFTDGYLYKHSDHYFLPDKTNRHGILHGTYADADYGEPINFYKAISAVDILCFISAIRAPISWLSPPTTPASSALADFYSECERLRSNWAVPSHVGEREVKQ
jgi:hypothetical protein